MRLRTLGTVELELADRTAATKVLAQPKRLALLVYLAVRPAGELVSRDRVLATFWPEAPTRRAQGSLRNSLYFLRSALGPGLIVSRGASIGVSTGAIRCDAADLLAGAEPVAAETQLALYRGEFLDGVHVTGAPDFERWVDRTRAVLRAIVVELAWSLSARSESAGEWISAARHARSATELAVDVEGSTQRLIRLLDRAGDRGAAVSEYERLVSWLSDEFGVSPSPETSALIARVRERGSSLPEPLSPSTVASDRRKRFRSLAVLPFEDLSEGSDGGLAAGLVEDLLMSLSRIRGIRVVSRTSVRRFGLNPPTSMQSVRDVLGVDLVLEGSIRRHQDRVKITVRLVDAALDERVWAETYDRQLTDVFEIQSDVAMRVVRSLEAQLSPREHERLRQVPTRNVKAYRLYLQGRELWSSRHPRDAERAVALFRQALAEDPALSLAWVGVADGVLLGAVMGSRPLVEAYGDGRVAVDRALAADPDLGEARATLGLMLTFMGWDHAAAERQYRRAVELVPGYASARQWYGQWLCLWGRFDEGLSELVAALRLDPLSPVINEGLGNAHHHGGRLDEAIAQLRHTLDLDPGYSRARLGLALCHADAGDVDTAVDELVGFWSAGAFGVGTAEAREVAALLDRGTDAVLERMLAGARSRIGNVPFTRVIEVMLLMLLERHDEAVQTLLDARTDRSLGFTMFYAPMLDPLADRAAFRQLFAGVGMMLPRWERPGWN